MKSQTRLFLFSRAKLKGLLTKTANTITSNAKYFGYLNGPTKMANEIPTKTAYGTIIANRLRLLSKVYLNRKWV